MAALLAIVLVLHLAVYVFDRFDIFGEMLVRRLGNMGTENTFPTWLSAALFGFGGVLCWLIGRSSDEQDRPYWKGLAMVMVVLSADEVASFHEAVAGPLRRLLSLEGFLYYAWVIPGVVAVVALVAVLWRFMARQERALRNQLILAGIVFFGASIGMEAIQGVLAGNERASIAFAAAVTVEEILELTGVAIAVDALVGHLAHRGTSIPLRFVE